jgi:YVTN family beta-propeller protein
VGRCRQWGLPYSYGEIPVPDGSVQQIGGARGTSGLFVLFGRGAVGYDLGVDLGTTFVAAAISRDGRTEMCTLGNQAVVAPAVVYFTEESKLIFGEAAERRVPGDPGRVERGFKRRLGDPTPVVLGGVPHQVTALMAEQLRDVLHTVTKVEGGPPDRVALTHPASWGPYRRELFEEVPRLAGLRDHTVLTEPEAAAAYYGATHVLRDGSTVAVYDLGGGTFDATVLRKRDGVVEVVGEPEGIERLGGIDFDEAIIQWINHRHGGVLTELDLSEPESAAAMAKLRQECVQAKEALSVDTETSIPVLLLNRRFVAQLSRREFESMIRAPIDSTIGVLVRAVHTARVKVDELSAVLLVGGSSRIPLIEQMITEETGRPTVTDTHPKYAVALGAAAVAAIRPATTRSRVPVPAGSSGAAVATPTGTAQPHLPSPRGVSRPTPPGYLPAQALPARSGRQRWMAAAVLAVLVLAGGVALLLTGHATRPASTAKPRASARATLRGAPAVAAAKAVPIVGTPVKLNFAPTYLAASPDGHHLYIAAGNRTVSVLDTASNRVTATIRVPGPAQFLSFSPDGRYVYVSLWDRQGGSVHAVSIVDTSDYRVKKTIPVRTRPFLAAVTPDGRWLYVPDHDTHTVALIDTTRMARVAEIDVPPDPSYVSFSTDGRRAYVADDESNEITVLDTATRQLLKNVKVGEAPRSVEQNPLRPMTVNVNGKDGTVSAMDTGTGTVRATVRVGRQPLNIHFSPDGRYAYVVNSGSNTVSVVGVDALKVTATLRTGESPTSIAVLPDGTRGYVSDSKEKKLTVLGLAG